MTEDTIKIKERLDACKGKNKEGCKQGEEIAL
jgi:hypothetical protein